MAENVKPYNQTDSWDGKYTNGDDLNYALGMVRARVLAKPKTSEGVYYGMGKGLKWSATGINATPELNVDETVFSFSSGILTLPISSEFPISLSLESGIDIRLNIGKGLYTGNSRNVPDTYQKLNLNLFNQKISNVDQNMSGLELTTGTATADGALAGNQLRIMLADLYAGSATPSNMSGLQIIEPGDFDSSGDFQTHGGLSIKYGDGLTLNNNGGLSIKNGKWLSFDSDGYINVYPGDLSFVTRYTQGAPYVDGEPLILVGEDTDGVVGLSNASYWDVKIPLANANIPGVVRTGYSSASERNFALQTDANGKGYVNVPSDNVDTWRPVYLGNTEKLGSGTNTRNLVFYSTNSINVDFDDEPHAFIFDVKLKTSMDSTPVNLSGLEIVSEVPQTQSNAHTAGLVVKPGLGLAVDSTGVKVNIDSVSEQPSSDSVTYNFKQGDSTVFSHTIGHADGTDAGLMSADDKSFLDALSGSNLFTWDSQDDELTVNVNAPLVLNSSGLGLSYYGSLGVGSNSLGVQFFTGQGSTNALDVRGTTPITSTTQGIYVKAASASQAGVTKLYTSVTDSTTDTNTDGSVTQAALNSAYQGIMDAIGNLEGVEFRIASTLPTASSTYKKYIYLIPISGASAPDAYAEYVCINKGTTASPNWAWEKIGDTNIDLSGYVQFTDNIGSAGVTAIVRDVFGF